MSKLAVYHELGDIQMVESTMHSMKKPNKITHGNFFIFEDHYSPHRYVLEAITEDGGSDISSIFPHKCKMKGVCLMW